MQIDSTLKPEDLRTATARVFAAAGPKIRDLAKTWNPEEGSPVITRAGKYTAQGWTEWTQGFQYGCALLQFDGTDDEQFLDLGRRETLQRMAPHLTHTGVHDHGFNTMSTYGNLWRFAREGKVATSGEARALYELAIKVSGAVQASRWTTLSGGGGYMYSFNGPQSLFSDTARTCRVLVAADQLGHRLMGEGDTIISLLRRAILHLDATLRYNVYYGEGRDTYDLRGRVVHESIFNTNNGNYRCPSTQQGYSPFTTWTRGLSWIVLGYAEQLEALDALPNEELAHFGGHEGLANLWTAVARAAADFYIENTALDGIPYWDTGAPGLAHMGDYLQRPAEPDNAHEPVDSSAAAITAQGLLRLGRYLGEDGAPYTQAGLTIARTLFSAPYLSEDPAHQGLLLHSVYHRPNGWDYVPEGKAVPQGESSMWGDYHLLELALWLRRANEGGPYPVFFDPA